MVKLYKGGAWLVNGEELIADSHEAAAEVRQKTGLERKHGAPVSHDSTQEEAGSRTLLSDVPLQLGPST